MQVHEKIVCLCIIISIITTTPKYIVVNASSDLTPTTTIQITEVGQISTTKPVLDLEVINNKIFFIEKDRGFVIYDVGDLSNISLIDEYFLPSPHDLSIQNNRVFVIDTTSGVVILDVSNPQNILELGVFSNITDATHISSVGHTLYVGDEMGGLLIVNTSDPSTPTLVGNWKDSEGGVSSVYPINNYLFAGIQIGRIGAPPLSLGLKILDVSKSTNVSEVISLGDGDEFSSMAPQDRAGSHVFLADLEYGFKILNFTEPTEVNSIGQYFDGGSAHDVQVLDNKAFIADGDDGLEIIDITNLSNLTKLKKFTTSSMALNLHIVGDTIYLATLNHGIHILRYASQTTSSETTTTTTIRETHWVNFATLSILVLLGTTRKR